MAILYLQAQTNDVATNRVLDFSTRIGVRNVARMARVLKVIEQLRGIHSKIVNGRRSPTLAQGPRPKAQGLTVFGRTFSKKHETMAALLQ
jgi:hypothetical protein